MNQESSSHTVQVCVASLLITVICICLQNNKIAVIEEHFKSLGHHNQLIVRFASAARPNLELKNPTFLGQKNEVSTTANMWF